MICKWAHLFKSCDDRTRLKARENLNNKVKKVEDTAYTV